jgi:indoleamine 2,3-dioxygenase
MDYYNHYKLSPDFGFLPNRPPISHFSTPSLLPLNQVAKVFTQKLQQKTFQLSIQDLATLDFSSIHKQEELELAYLYYSVFAHGFVWEKGVASGYLPPNIVLPWLQICEKLDRVPILTYNSIVMHNWKLIDSNQKISLDNLETLICFNDLVDEAWFFLLSVELEYIGTPIVRLGIDLVKNNYKIQAQKRAQFLKTLSDSILAITNCLSRMYENCDPHNFYTYLRPFLSSFESIEYRGAKENPFRSYHGGSAAQSSLIQLIDCILQIDHGSERTGQYLKKMRFYMPKEHRLFLETIEKNSPINQWLTEDAPLRPLYNDCIKRITHFRQVHLEIVAKYIMGQKQKVGPGHTGTGGTNPMIFLKALKKDSSDQKR